MSRILGSCLKLLIAVIALVIAIEYLKTIWPYLLAAAIVVTIITVVVWWIRRRNTW